MSDNGRKIGVLHLVRKRVAKRQGPSGASGGGRAHDDEDADLCGYGICLCS